MKREMAPALGKSSAATQAAVRAAFGSDGALARSVDGFVARTSQAAMALAVLDAIEAGGTLVAEAGTGTGKTFAYLVPALLAGGKVLVSTGTKPLQDQLFRKDLPAVMRALHLNASSALLKGRANYVCLQRMARTELDGLLPSREDAAHLRSVVRFAATTHSGDRAELDSVPEGASIWPYVTSTRDNCLGSDCPRFADCFVFKARREAQMADIVIVNHHLFMADLALRDESIREFLPLCDTVILDEAHQLPAVATEFFGSTLSLAQLNEVARDGRALGLQRASDGASWSALADALERAARDLRITLADMGVGPGRRVPLDRLPAPRRVLAAFAEIGAALSALERAVEANRGRDAELDLLAPRAAGLRAMCEQWSTATLTDADPDQDPDAAASVRWVAATNYGAQFHTTPLSLADAFARAREAQTQAWIMTSATLSSGGRFDHFLLEMGLDGAATARWESPFDFQHQALLYLPTTTPPPSDPSFAEAAAEIAWPVIVAAGGRCFFLCTTLRAVDRVADRLRWLMRRDGIELPLMVQGTGARRGLLDGFRDAGNAVLVGSVSFWEGIDIRGEALSLVVIDKLPFAPPDDPVVEAKIRYLRKKGRNAFDEFQLPQAITLLKQGAGRLIRDEHDRGVLIILDERLLTKGYGKTVLASLPPFARTRSEAEACAFFTARAGAPIE